MVASGQLTSRSLSVPERGLGSGRFNPPYPTNLSFSPTFRLGFRSRYIVPNHSNGFKNDPHTKEDPHMSTHSYPIKRNIIASGLIRRSTRCLLSGMAWNGELRETIKMV